jgi:lysophospholipase L1-like esterase
MRSVFVIAGYAFFLFIFIGVPCFAECEGNLDFDHDVDGIDLAVLIGDFGRTDCGNLSPCRGDIFPVGEPDDVVDGSDLELFAADFGREDCELPVPVNLFNIGDSIGEGEAANGVPRSKNRNTVWSTGYDPAGMVYTINERFDYLEPVRYTENNADRDPIFNIALSGSVMFNFAFQAAAVVEAASATPYRRIGMVIILLGANDVCALTNDDMTPPGDFADDYRAGLEILASSEFTNQATIHVSGIPAIYWLWNAKRGDGYCEWFWDWFIPCENLLALPDNDCAGGGSHLDPDHINPGDGENCVRRKQFHAQIRDVYNPILRDELLVYKFNGRLPNAYYIDILDIEFFDNHVNDGDCFHPSIEGHELLAEEQWCRSPWGMEDPGCQP